MRVLISAYACEPHKGSEGGVGWNWSQQIAKFAETWVVTRANNEEVIEEELAKRTIPNLHFVYVDLPERLRFWKKGEKRLYIYYLIWQILVLLQIRKLNKKVNFDFVHHLTFGNLWLPTFISFLPIRFIWGPIGGGEVIPKCFRKSCYLRSRIKEFTRNLIINTLNFNLLFLHNCKKADVIIAKTIATANRIPAPHRSKVVVTTDVAISPKNMKAKNRVRGDIKVIAVGRLDAWRAFDLLIKAFSRACGNHSKVNLLIVGDGIDKQRLYNICKRENILDKVIFKGRVSREEYKKCMSSSMIFVNPCLREGGVTVLFDALLFGLPVICIDNKGVSEIITKDCGIKITEITPEQVITDLQEALLMLFTNEDLRKRMGEIGRKRVQELYTWDKKGEIIADIYAGIN